MPSHTSLKVNLADFSTNGSQKNILDVILDDLKSSTAIIAVEDYYIVTHFNWIIILCNIPY